MKGYAMIENNLFLNFFIIQFLLFINCMKYIIVNFITYILIKFRYNTSFQLHHTISLREQKFRVNMELSIEDKM